MLSAFVHRRPLLRALLALLLFAGLFSTAVATHAGLTSGHPAAAIDNAAGDLDTSWSDDSASAQDDGGHDTLDIPDGLIVPNAVFGKSTPMTSHPTLLRWHANSELRPPIA